MGDEISALPALEPLDPNTLRSRIRQLEEIQRNCNDVSELSPSEEEELLKNCVLQLEEKVTQILSDYSDVSSLAVEDLDTYLEQLEGELSMVKAESAQTSDEIENLMRGYLEDSNRLESNIEGLNCSLNFIASQGLEKEKADAQLECSTQAEDQMVSLSAHGGCKFKILELDTEVEKKKRTLKSLQDLECTHKRFESVEKIEDALTGLKIIEFEGNCIRLSLRTYIPDLESFLREQKIENISDTLEQNHELSIEVVEGTMDVKNVEIFPNDVYIGEIIDVAKSFRQLFSSLLIPDTRNSFEWFVRRVQERIVLCTLRRFLVKSANKSRHSFEYLDREETIVAHMVGGVDAFLKVSQGWPVTSSVLKLVSLKSSSQYSKEVSLSFLCKVEEAANSLDAHVRQNISSFVDSIEEILVQRMRAELQSDGGSEK